MVMASQMGYVTVANMLLADRSNDNTMDEVINKPLHWAIRCGHATVAEVLLASGVDFNANNNLAGKTLMFKAVKSGHTKQGKGNRESKGADGRTATMVEELIQEVILFNKRAEASMTMTIAETHSCAWLPQMPMLQWPRNLLPIFRPGPRSTPGR